MWITTTNCDSTHKQSWKPAVLISFDLILFFITFYIIRTREFLFNFIFPFWRWFVPIRFYFIFDFSEDERNMTRIPPWILRTPTIYPSTKLPSTKVHSIKLTEASITLGYAYVSNSRPPVEFPNYLIGSFRPRLLFLFINQRAPILKKLSKFHQKYVSLEISIFSRFSWWYFFFYENSGEQIYPYLNLTINNSCIKKNVEKLIRTVEWYLEF